MRRRTAAVLLGIIASAIVPGLLLDPQPFIENLLAETAGAAASILVGLMLVERLIQRQRSRQWERVRLQTVRAILAHIMDIGLEYYMVLPVSIRQEEQEFMYYFYELDLPSEEAAQGLARISKHVLGQKEELVPLSSRDFHEHISPHIHQLRDVLTPRVLELNDDPNLVEVLMDVETAERSWIYHLGLENRFGAPEEFGWESSAGFLEACSKVVAQLSA
jgi:hypothetical protein